MNCETIISTALGVLSGGLITWCVSKYYYKMASKDLIVASRKLNLMSDLILYKLQHPDAETEPKFDKDGDVVGLLVHMKTKK